MIRQPWLALISGILFVVAFLFVVERLRFLSGAERTAGYVVKVSAQNSRCGGGRRRRSYPCTKFQANIQFTTNLGVTSSFWNSAGSCSGTNVSETCASYKTGQSLPVIYDPQKPSKAYIDTVMGVWGTPIMLFLMQAVTFISSLFEPRRRRQLWSY